MTLLAERERTTDPVAALHACLDQLDRVPVERLDAEGHALWLRSLTRAEARITAKKLQVLAAADEARTGLKSGAASTGQWAASLANADQGAVQHQVRLAQGLQERTATRAALGAGTISPEHAAVIIQTDHNLPNQVTPEQRATVEQSLINGAATLAPAALRKAARRALAAIEPDVTVVDAHENDLVAAAETRARARTRLTLHDNEDGTVTGHFTVPVLHGHLLRKIIATMTAPRRGRLGASHAQAGDNGLRKNWDHARGEAFCELLEHLPTDHLHPRTAATLVVTLDLETLREALKVANLDTAVALSAGETRRLACNATLVPVVLGGTSLPLDLGRSARLFSETQRTALGTLHTTCAADGCERPFAWCELHHDKRWAHGGRTDLKDAVPVCHFHHQRIHDPSYQHHRRTDGSISFHQRT